MVTVDFYTALNFAGLLETHYLGYLLVGFIWAILAHNTNKKLSEEEKKDFKKVRLVFRVCYLLILVILTVVTVFFMKPVISHM